jgi:hypothetical protein
VHQLQLDSVGVVEEDGVVARRVLVLCRAALDPRSMSAEPLRSLIDDIPGGDVEAEVVYADGVSAGFA